MKDEMYKKCMVCDKSLNTDLLNQSDMNKALTNMGFDYLCSNCYSKVYSIVRNTYTFQTKLLSIKLSNLVRIIIDELKKLWRKVK